MKSNAEALYDFDDVYLEFLKAERDALKAHLKLAYAMIKIWHDRAKELESK
jgi:hypothetical protein